MTGAAKAIRVKRAYATGIISKRQAERYAAWIANRHPLENYNAGDLFNLYYAVILRGKKKGKKSK